MAFRTREPDRLCTVCREIATGACVRCAGPVCPPHTAAVHLRCERCEQFFAHTMAASQLRRTAVMAAGSALEIGLVAACVISLDGAGLVAVGSLFAAAIGLPVLSSLRMGRERRAFLAERQCRLKPHRAPI